MTEQHDEIRINAAATPLGLFVYTLVYGGMTVLAGVLAFKQVQLYPTDLAVESGIFAFLLLVVISSTIAQLYGEKLANRIVWWGFLPLLIAALLMQLVLHLPASPEMAGGRAEDLAAFEQELADLEARAVALAAERGDYEDNLHFAEPFGPKGTHPGASWSGYSQASASSSSLNRLRIVIPPCSQLDENVSGSASICWIALCPTTAQ